MSQEKRNSGACQDCGAQLLPGARFCHQCGAPIDVPLKEDKQTSLLDKDAILETSEPQEKRLPKLYHVYSIVNNFRYKDIFYDNLKINWFVLGRETPQVPFEKVIVNYSGLSTTARIHPENHIKEKFTLVEAELIKQFLASSQKIDVVIEEKVLPVGKDEIGYHDLPPTPDVDFITLYKKKPYDLPFNVEGVFNIKMADERVVPDDQITVISKIPTEIFNK